MSTAQHDTATLTLFAISNKVDPDHARDAYAAIARVLDPLASTSPVAILDALAEIGMVPGVGLDDLLAAERATEEANEEAKALRQTLGDTESERDDLRLELEDAREDVKAADAALAEERRRADVAEDERSRVVNGARELVETFTLAAAERFHLSGYEDATVAASVEQAEDAGAAEAYGDAAHQLRKLAD